MPKYWPAKFVVLLFAVGGAAAAASSVDVVQNDRHFNLAVVKIARGTLVRFLNQDEFVHHIEVDNEKFAFDSGEQPPGQSVQVVFPRNGTFDVHCAIHPKMHLTVEVD